MATEITFTVLTAIVIALVQIAKQLGLPSKYAGLAAVILGVLGTLGLSLFTPTATVIFTGIVIGLVACGLYSQGKKLKEK